MKTEKKTREQILREKGVDIDAFNREINQLYFLFDLCESSAVRIESKLKNTGLFIQQNKLYVKKLRKMLTDLNASVNKTLKNEQTQLGFGAHCDFVDELISEALKVEESEFIKVLSSVKNLKRREK